MITISQALKIISRENKMLGTERVELSEAAGRVLAEDIFADSDLPPFDRSQMDGFAVLARDTQNLPVKLRIAGESAAGRGWHGVLKRGQAVRIMTGARLPIGADAIQKVELTSEANGLVTINEPTAVGRYIVAKGKEVKKGSKVLRSGEILSAKNIAIPAAFGYSRVKVAKRPRVAILSTGSEIVDIGKKPKLDQIRNSNSVMIRALSERAGAIATVVTSVGDDLEQLKAQIASGVRHSDILVTTGGVSVGKYDLTKIALKELGAELFFEQVRLKPGKPTVFARLKKTLVFGLPGNPVSAAVTFHLLVRKAIMKMQNRIATDQNSEMAILAASVKAPKDRDAYLPAKLSTAKDGRLIAEALVWHGSSDLVGFAKSDGLIVVPADHKFAGGDVVEVLILQ